jgi:transcription elongation factor S-II
LTITHQLIHLSTYSSHFDSYTMDSRTIIEKSKALQKAQANSESVSVIIGILNELRKGVAASEETLRSTKIGVTVARAKQHKNPEVARLASDIVRKWREEVEKQRGGGSHTAKKAAASGGNNSKSAPSPVASETKSPVSLVPPEQRNWKKDNVDTAKTAQASRNKCIGLLYDGIVFKSTAPSPEVLSVAQAIEAAIFADFGPEDKPSYGAKVRSLFANLKNKSNATLRQQVLSGVIAPERFVNLSEAELLSEEQRNKDKEHEKENDRMMQKPEEEKVISDMTCRKCGQKKVSYTQAQTRAADEPMTTFCHCLHCGSRWRE